jgi:hypothetical protein
VSLPRIAGHRDGDATECPGNVLYDQLPAIRTGVRGLAPNPTRATLALTAPSIPPETGTAPQASGTPTPGNTPSGQAQALSGVLELLDGSPLSGAPVQVQSRTVSRKGEVVSERMLGQATTNSAGQWLLDATPLGSPGGGMWLRALCPGGPGFGAAVSDPLHLPESVSLTEPAMSAPTN